MSAYGMLISDWSSDVCSSDLGSIDESEESFARATYGAVILERGLPDGDGLEWLRRERPRRPLPPVLILTARDGMGDRIAGLDAGGDDYLVKPVDIEELAARLRALMRRPGARELPIIRAGKLAFNVAARTARSGDHVIELTRREADLLELLIRRAGDRKSVVEGKRVSVSVDLGGRRIIKKKKTNKQKYNTSKSRQQ